MQSDPILDVVSLDNLLAPEGRQASINRTCSFKNQLKHQGCPNEFQVCKEDFYFMLRKEAIQLMDYIDNLSDQGRIVDLGKALFGSGGTGKSSLLFFISNYCKIKGWMVLYLPFDSNSSEEVFTERKAEQIVNRFLEDNQNCSIDVSELESLQGVKKLMKLLDNLYSQKQQKTLVAIDQWNVFLKKLREKKNNDGLFLDFFNTFQTSGDLENGIFMGALSSQSFFSFDLDVFPDATKQSSSIVLTSCTTNLGTEDDNSEENDDETREASVERDLQPPRKKVK